MKETYETMFCEELCDLDYWERLWLQDLLQNPEEMNEFQFDDWAITYWTEDPTQAPDGDYWPGFIWRLEESRLVIHDRDGQDDTEHLIQVIEMFLQWFRPEQEKVITWAYFCDENRPGGFRGGSHTCNPQAKPLPARIEHELLIQIEHELLDIICDRLHAHSDSLSNLGLGDVLMAVDMMRDPAVRPETIRAWIETMRRREAKVALITACVGT